MTDAETRAVIVVHKNAVEGGVGGRIARRQGVRFHHTFDSAGSSTANLSRNEINQLALDPDVELIAPDQAIFATGLDKGGEAVGAYQAQQAYGLTGKGVGVAFIDSGVSYYNCD